MKGYVEMSSSILPSASLITINAELRSLEDAKAFVALFNATCAEVFPAPADAEDEERNASEIEGEDA